MVLDWNKFADFRRIHKPFPVSCFKHSSEQIAKITTESNETTSLKIKKVKPISKYYCSFEIRMTPGKGKNPEDGSPVANGQEASAFDKRKKVISKIANHLLTKLLLCLFLHLLKLGIEKPRMLHLTAKSASSIEVEIGNPKAFDEIFDYFEILMKSKKDASYKEWTLVVELSREKPSYVVQGLKSSTEYIFVAQGLALRKVYGKVSKEFAVETNAMG